MDSEFPEWRAEFNVRERAGSVILAQSEMFPLELSGTRPAHRGADLAFIADVGSDIYYCKEDKPRRPIRAVEWFLTSLASHINIAVPAFASIRHPHSGETYFGSKNSWGTADDFDARAYLLAVPQIDRAIGPNWKGQYLSGLFAFDLFVGNPDRQMANFLLVADGGGRRLLAFDFASSDISLLGTTKFPIAESKTLSVGRLLRKQQGFYLENAIEIIDRIAAVPVAMIESMLSSMPEDWMLEDDKGRVCDQWSNGSIEKRLVALRLGLSDGSLL